MPVPQERPQQQTVEHFVDVPSPEHVEERVEGNFIFELFCDHIVSATCLWMCRVLKVRKMLTTSQK